MSAGHGTLHAGPEVEELTASPLPAAPPPEALAAVEAAARLSETLASTGYELRFGAGPSCRPIELRAGDGALLRTLTPAEALDWITDA